MSGGTQRWVGGPPRLLLDIVDSCLTARRGSVSLGHGGRPDAAVGLDGVLGAVVQIVAEGSFVDPEAGAAANAAGSGLGFIIDPATGIAGQNLCRVFDDGVDGRPIGLAVQHADPPGRGLDLPVRPKRRTRIRYHSEKGWAMRLALK